MQEPLSSAVNDIRSRAPLCVPPAVAPTPQPTVPAEEGGRHGKRGQGQGKGGHGEKDD